MSRFGPRLLDAWTSFFQERPAYFVTVTFNWRGGMHKSRARERLRIFSRQLDQRRLGSRFYEHPPSERTLFMFVPEAEDCAMLHYHGLLREPDDSNSKYVPDDYKSFIAECWKSVVPSGTCDVQNLTDSGALFYSTKETSFNSDDVIGSHAFWSVQPKEIEGTGVCSFHENARKTSLCPVLRPSAMDKY